jgi:tetratricopeptide (TPR) repeat protein
VAWIGLGNAAYAAGDLDEAEAAFRTVAERHLNAAAAWNNLAHVLGQKGRRAEAVAAAQRAVRLGGPNVMMYRETLREVAGG